MITSSFEQDIIEHANLFPDEEVCGFVLFDYEKGAYAKPMLNISDNKKISFKINPSEYLKYKSSDKLLGIYHSHPTSSESPSDFDLINAKEVGLPYLIYSLLNNKFFLHYPETYSARDYIGRPHIRGFFECTTIARDYYKKEKKLDFSNWVDNHWPPENYEEINDMIFSMLTSRGKKINIESIKKGDVILFGIAKRIHCGVYVGDGEFIHQLLGKFSSKEMLDDRYKRFIKAIYRYSENDLLTL